MATRGPIIDTLDRPPAAPAAAPRRRLELSATQVLASALAAITATVAGSFLGVSGTVIGAAVASVVTVVGNAVYGHSLRRTRDRVREVVPRFAPAPGRPFLPEGRSTAATAALTEEMPVLSAHRIPAGEGGPWRAIPSRESGPWRAVALGSIAVFAAVLAVVTGVEIIAGRPLADLVRGDSGAGTSVFGDAGQAPSTVPNPTHASVPTVTRTVTPIVVITTPTVTRTAPAVTRTATPTVTTTPSSSAPSSPVAPPSSATTSP